MAKLKTKSFTLAGGPFHGQTHRIPSDPKKVKELDGELIERVHIVAEGVVTAQYELNHDSGVAQYLVGSTHPQAPKENKII